jgi:hypothetical protein
VIVISNGAKALGIRMGDPDPRSYQTHEFYWIQLKLRAFRKPVRRSLGGPAFDNPYY